jgi:hypothetical protein
MAIARLNERLRPSDARAAAASQTDNLLLLFADAREASAGWGLVAAARASDLRRADTRVIKAVSLARARGVCRAIFQASGPILRRHRSSTN